MTGWVGLEDGTFADIQYSNDTDTVGGLVRKNKKLRWNILFLTFIMMPQKNNY